MAKLFATDLNQTLVDSELGHLGALNVTLEKMGKLERATLQYIREVIGKPLAAYYTTLYPNAPEEEINQFLALMPESFGIHIPANEKLMPYAYEVLIELKRRGYNIAVVSAMPNRGIDTTLRRHKIGHLVDGMLGIEEVEQRGGYDVGEKKGTLLRNYIRDTDADRAFMMGDTEDDITAGREAGAMTLYFNRDGRKNINATYSVSDWREVLGIV